MGDGLRLRGLSGADVENAFNSGALLRTHLLRLTWHFVTPAEIGWLLALTAPRVNAASAYWHRKFELDITVFASGTAIQTGGRAVETE